MGPSPSSPVPTLVPNPLTLGPQGVLVGETPIRAQRTPPRTLISRGCSPIPTLDLPPEIAAFFNSTQMQLQTTQESEPVFLPVRPQDPEVISLTSSGSQDSERPFSKSRMRARSPTIVPETQVLGGFMMDCFVCSFFSVCILLTHVSSRSHRLERQVSWLGSVGSWIRPRVDNHCQTCTLL